MSSIKLASILEKLQSQFLFIKSSAILTPDGLMLADTFISSVDSDDIAALTSALNAFSSKTAQSLNLGKPLEVFIQCKRQSIVITETLDGLILAVIVNSEQLCELDLPELQKFISKKYWLESNATLAA